MNRRAIGTKSFLLVLLFFCALAFLCACSQNTPPSPHYSHTTYTLELQGDEVVSDTDWVVVLEKDPAKDFVILDIQVSEPGASSVVRDRITCSWNEKVTCLNGGGVSYIWY